MSFLPVKGAPPLRVVFECTSLIGRHLLSHLQRFHKLSRNETPVGRLHAFSPEPMPNGFGVEPCFRLYLLAFPRAFASHTAQAPARRVRCASNLSAASPSACLVEHPDSSVGGFPEGFSCHHSDPIRYIVRRASHPVISATVARLRNFPAPGAGLLQVSTRVQSNRATSCRTPTLKSPAGVERSGTPVRCTDGWRKEFQ